MKRLMGAALLRLLGGRITQLDDHWTRITVPRKRAALFARVVENVRADAWRKNKTVTVEESGDVTTITSAGKRVDIRRVG